MSRIGKNPIVIPSETKVSIKENIVSITNKEKTISYTISPLLEVLLEDNKIILKPLQNTSQAKTLWGTNRNILNNIIKGASENFTKTLEINGVGYRAAVENVAGKMQLILQLGYSHEIKYVLPSLVKAICPKPTQIILSSSCKQTMGQVASEIRSYRMPEPYKGKGIKYENEKILRKEGKKK